MNSRSSAFWVSAPGARGASAVTMLRFGGAGSRTCAAAPSASVANVAVAITWVVWRISKLLVREGASKVQDPYHWPTSGHVLGRSVEDRFASHELADQPFLAAGRR